MSSSGRSAGAARELDRAVAVRSGCRRPVVRLLDATGAAIRFAALFRAAETGLLRAAGAATLRGSDAAGAARSGATGAADSTELVEGVSDLAAGLSDGG
jgi:hypothetical protein